MKKTVLGLMAASMMLIAAPAQLTAGDALKTAGTTEAVTEEVAAAENMTAAEAEMLAEVRSLVDRLEEIRSSDFSEMSRAEKKELRKEVRTINNELAAYSKADSESEAMAAGEQMRGVYISGGAILVIILLVLLL